MQQKYLHEHALSNNLINNKLRQEMYLRHLREVEKINNRDREGLRRELLLNRSIEQVHRRNKIKAFEFRVREKSRVIEEKNGKIHSKISSIGSDGNINNGIRKERPISLHLTSNTQSKQKQKIVESADSQGKPKSHSHNNPNNKQSLHYRYRKRQQEHIQQQNAKLMKAILSQRSTLLPVINNHTGGGNGRQRASSQLQNSRSSSKNRYSNNQEAGSLSIGKQSKAG